MCELVRIKTCIHLAAVEVIGKSKLCTPNRGVMRISRWHLIKHKSFNTFNYGEYHLRSHSVRRVHQLVSSYVILFQH